MTKLLTCALPLVLAVSSCAGHVPETEALAPSAKPLVLAVYYTWYSTGTGPHGIWASWGTPSASLLAPEGCDPAVLVDSGMAGLPPFHRIASCDYPLIGPYDSDDPEVVRWHMKLAKAAGIDALLVDWWGEASWQKPAGLTYNAFIDVVLPIAEEEGMKVALFDETAQFVEDFGTVKAWAAEYLARFVESPAYLRIDGEPVYAIYQVPFDPRLSPGQLVELRDYVEERVGPVYWMVDKMANGASPFLEGEALCVPEAFLALDWIDAFMDYGTFSVRRVHRYEDIAPLYKAFAQQAQGRGFDVALPVHPGHNNSKLQTAPYVIPRGRGRTLAEYLGAAEAAGADAVIVTSFNEWPETTQVEPAITQADPYCYLRMLAEWGGKEFVPPPELERTLRKR